jgi:transposase
MIHVGVDLHRRVSQVAVMTEAGDITQHRLVNDPATVRGFFADLPPARVAVEATGTWWWFTDLVQELAHHPVLSHPKQTKAIAAARLKNDRVDAERLLLLLRGELLPTVWIPPASLREARELVRHRVGLVRTRTTVKNRLLALLARRNLQRPAGASWLTAAGRGELERLALNPIPATIRDDGLTLLRLLDEHVRRLDHDLTRRWGSEPVVQRLMTIPGIGAFTAVLLFLELGEIARFRTAKHLASYVGLTPRVRASADHIRTGHISKEGNHVVRWALIVSATQAARRPGPLRAWYRTLERRKGKKVARVALARRLTEIVYHVWRDQVTYFTLLRRGDADMRG